MEQLVLHTDWKVPTVATREVLVKVHACGLNNTDVNTRSGWYSKAVTGATSGAAEKINADDPSWGGKPLDFPRIQGGDVCGTVVAVGDDAPEKLLGRRVMIDTVLRDWDDPRNIDKMGYFGSECDGGFADYVKTDARQIAPVDCDLSHAEIATFAIAYSTAENMLTRSGVHENDTVLITGASGGVGSALVQLAKRRGATVVAMASEAKHTVIKTVGADAVLPRAPENLKAALQLALGAETVSVVADVVGGDYFPTVFEAIRKGGRYVTSGAIAGALVELDLRTLYLRDLTMFGATVLAPEIFPNLVGYIERREIKPLLAATYPLEQLHEAQQCFIDKKHVGNIVVTM